MHRLSANFVLGYHGCRREVGEQLLAGVPFRPSDNSWDWLGPGAYFWEANPDRAWQWASQTYGDEGFAVGAVVDPGLCLDLTSASGLIAVRQGYKRLFALSELAGTPLPRNSQRDPADGDRVVRRLDCAVIRMVHTIDAESSGNRIDTVRGVFTEGEPLYPGGGIQSLTHIQYAVCNLDCIKGVFRVPQRS